MLKQEPPSNIPLLPAPQPKNVPPKVLPDGKTPLWLLAAQVKKILKSGIWYVAGIAAVTAILLVLELHSNGRIYPRTMLGPVDLGYQTVEEAKKTLEARLETFLQQSQIFNLEGKEIQVPLTDLGIETSSEQLLNLVPHIEFEKTNPLLLIGSLVAGRQIPLQFTLDSNRVLDTLGAKFDITKFRAQNAKLVLNEKKKWDIQEEISGKVINQEKLQSDLEANLENLENTPIHLEFIEEKPTLLTAQLKEKQAEFEATLGNTVTLLSDGKKWKMVPKDHLDAVEVGTQTYVSFKDTNVTLPIVLETLPEPQDESTVKVFEKATLSLNPSKIADYLEKEIVAQIDKPTSDVNISTGEKGKIIIDGKGQNGLSVQKHRLVAGLNLALNKGLDRVQIPVREEKAKVTVSENLQDLGIKNLIATGHTAFVGSPSNRRHNINVGISRYNGLLVKPGETFSFNDHLGPVDGEHGFRQELVIKAEGTIPEYGGGLCQVSSTLYRAAVYGGFPIVERAPHSYAVSYYAQIGGYGLDGTIYPGVHDVRFLNDTSGNILIQSYTEDDQAYFKFYGTDDGRKVRMEGPYLGNYHSPGPAQIVETESLGPGQKKQVENSHTGFDATWYRYLTKDGKEEKETIFSRYRAIPAKVLVGKSVEAVPPQEASVPST